MTNGHKLNMRKEAKKDMMVKFGKKIVKFRVPILILSILLLIPSALGYLHTRINYDVLTYLPDNIETMKGQDILVNDFGTGAFSMFIVDGMEDKDVSKLKQKIEKVDHVKDVIWYDSIADISMPKSMLPTKVYDAFNSETGTMMAIFFDEGTSSDGNNGSNLRDPFSGGRAVLFKWYVSCCYRYEGAGGERDTVVCIDRGCTGDDRARSYNGIVLCTNPLHAQYRNCNCI